jgi:hypothetical protein
MDLDTMLARVRADLRDPDGERWSDETLTRHVEHALGDLSLAAPREVTATLTTTDGSRELSLASLTGLVAIDAVEYPASQYPPLLVPFSTWGDTLTLEIGRTPAEGEAVTVRYSATHTLDGLGDAEVTTVPDALHDLVVTGVAAYAAIEWASYATNRVNVGGDDVWRRYLTWGQDRLASFSRALAKHGRERRLRSRRLFVASASGGRRELGA